jgi:Tfp pilus assembly protein PilF
MIDIRRTALKKTGAGAFAALARGYLILTAVALGAGAQDASKDGELLEKTGTVLYSHGGGPEVPAKAPQPLFYGDKVRTLELSQATGLHSNLTRWRIGELTTLEFVAPATSQDRPIMNLLRGALYFFSRGQPHEAEIQTPHGVAGVKGTEVEVSVESNATVVTVYDGSVEMSNAFGSLTLESHQSASMSDKAAPRLEAVRIVQWWLYYPGVLDTNDLGFTPQERASLGGSLEAYGAGDVHEALRSYPAGRDETSDAGRAYRAQLLLAAGEVAQAEELIGSTGPDSPLKRALRLLIRAVAYETNAPSSGASFSTASEQLALSYYLQSQFDLTNALKAARAAAQQSARFGFGWERVAELEFSFGHTEKAIQALDRSLALAPRNAQAHALKGFLLSAQDRIAGAIIEFDRALELDGALANAWLGRGLCRIKQRHPREGLADLQTAVVLEPNRSLLHSYLGKAFANVQDNQRAAQELALAERLDGKDPTPWLYSALMDYNAYQIADAIHDLDQSKQLNTNRLVYRSRLLLDEDQAVRSANQADIYKDVGMVDVSLDEAGRALALNPANFSAHLNLASTYDQLRDPTRFNLRYETPTLSELMLSGLLAPPGANSLSENLSQQEYSPLFAVNTIGFNQTAEVYSDGDYRQRATQYGTLGDTSWASDLYYEYKSGFRVNNDLSNVEWNTRVKEQITPEDSLFILTEYENLNEGDQNEYYNASQAEPSLRLTETQTPLLFAGWHHEWEPGSHTLFLASRLEDDQHYSTTNFGAKAVVTDPLGTPGVDPFNLQYQSQWEIYTAELSQILQRAQHTDVFGARYEEGRVNAQDILSNPAIAPSAFALPEVSAANADLERFSAYEYHSWEIVDGLMLIGGVSFDHLRYPANFRAPPLSSGESERDQWSPKAALIWTPAPPLTFRAMFSQTLGGVIFEESTRLEPTQLAGFVQDYRSLISESITGELAAPRYQILGAAMDWRLGSNTWLTLQGEDITERVDQQIGAFFLNFGGRMPPGVPASTAQDYGYTENTATLTLNHIFDKQWFVQAQYQYSDSDLKTTYPNIPATASFSRASTLAGDLQQLSLSGTWQAPDGFFAEAEVLSFFQDLGGSESHPEGRSFAQGNLYGGYRFRNRRAELICGVLNLTGGDFHLSPINYYLDLPHERLFYSRFRFNF